MTSKQFVETLQTHHPSFAVTYAPLEADFHTIKKAIDADVQENDLILLLGAGKLNRIVSTLL